MAAIPKADKPASDKSAVAASTSQGAGSQIEPVFLSNKCDGRLICGQDRPLIVIDKRTNQQKLKDASERYQNHANGKAPLSARESVELRAEIDRLSQIESPGSQSAWPEYTAAEKAYIAEQAEEKARQVSRLGVAFAGSFFGLPAAGAELAGAPVEVVNNLTEIGLNVAGAVALRGAGGSGSRGTAEQGSRFVEPSIRVDRSSTGGPRAAEPMPVAKPAARNAEVPVTAPTEVQKKAGGDTLTLSSPSTSAEDAAAAEKVSQQQQGQVDANRKAELERNISELKALQGGSGTYVAEPSTKPRLIDRKRYDELSRDPAHGGKINAKSRREAEVARVRHLRPRCRAPIALRSF